MEDPRTKRLRRMLYQATKLQQTADRLIITLAEQLDRREEALDHSPSHSGHHHQPPANAVDAFVQENIE